MAKKKQPKIGVGASVSNKTPKADTPIDFYKLRPAWRISLLEMCDPYGWHKLEKDKLEEIRLKLSDFETQTWNEILLISKKHNHSISVEDLSKEARKRLAERKLDDLEEVISLRLSGKERVFGVRQEIALTLLWWDPNHEVCPSELKHT